MRKKRTLAAASLIVGLTFGTVSVAGAHRAIANASSATVINVPADYPTLQAAVSAAASGDVIVLAPGTYQGGVWIQDKALTIASRYYTTSDPALVDQTIVNGFTPGYCGGAPGCAGNVVIEFGSRTSGSAVVGLTVSGGTAGDGVRGNARVNISHSVLTANEDGADFGNGSGGTFSDNVFVNNTDDGIDLNNAVDVRIVNNTIRDNGDDGIEFRLYPYTGAMLTTEVSGNKFIHNDSDGIQLIDSPGASSRIIRIEHNLFTQQRKAAIACMPDQNTNEDYSGAQLEERVYVLNDTFTNEHYGVVGGGNTIDLNNIFTGTALSALRRVGTNSISAYNLFWSNGLNYEDTVVDATTFVLADPKLAADWTLQAGSPAIDAGTAFFQWRGETVLDLPASAYMGSKPDLGAFESSGGGPPPANTAPRVDAGVDLSVTLPADAGLDATVSDDGLPSPPAAVTTAWTVDSGPGTVSFANAAAVDTRASFSAAGTYVLRLAAGDGELSAADTVQVTVQPAPPPGASTLERRVAAGADDAEESATGAMSLTSSDLELVFDGNNQRVGIRFANVTVPRGATISRAYVQFEADEAQSDPTSLVLQGEAADNAAAYTTTANNISARPRTTASTNWAPAPWTLVSEVGANQRTPDLANIIREITNRPSWAAGNALSLIITGSGHRTARAYEVKPTGAPLLHIEYDSGG
ncbi:MAG: right-handed parallel beta-helix repeat-containing protein [Gaiellaceae bacterium]